MISPIIRSKVSYPKLDEDELNDVMDAVSEFLTWLTEHQLANQDFIRQAIIDGMRQFQFRVNKIKWTGWGYTIQSLKDVIAAYKMLEGAVPNPSTAPDAEAVLKKGAKFFVRVFETIGVAKGTVEKADFLLRAYGAIGLIQHGTTVAGLLTHLNG